MPHLVVREPGRMAFSIPVGDGFRVGRHEQNDLVLADHQVSRQHVTLTREADGWRVRDLESRHGTLVNGERIQERRIAGGDRIQVGNVLLVFHEGDDPSRIVHAQITAAGPPAPADRSDRRLRLFYEVSRAIGAMGDTDELLGNLMEAVVEELGCDRALAGLGDAARGVARRVVRVRRGSRDEDVIVSRSILDATLGRREAVIVRDARAEGAQPTLARERVLSAMAVPLGLGVEATGLIYVDDRQQAERFTAADLEFLTALAHLASAAVESASRYQRATALADALEAGSVAEEIVGASPAIQRVKAQIARYGAAGGANVLIRGESGTGKELVARALHAASPRAAGPFVTLNCAAIPEALVESELFGHERGAFTGAARAKRGKFALADGGTLFLDEIGDLDLAAQAKLLRAIQEGEIQPLGSERPRRVDVRVVSATHKDLAAEIAAKRFREDLYYRLDVVEIDVPPLREREGDVEIIALALLRRAAAAMGKRVEGFTEAALAVLRRYSFPGNVRELKNEVERAVIHADGPVVDAPALSPRLGAARPALGALVGKSLAERFAELEPTERHLVEEALSQARGNLSEAARLLGITRIMMKRRADRFGLRGKDE